jgi:hypothetical protein
MDSNFELDTPKADPSKKSMTYQEMLKEAK